MRSYFNSSMKKSSGAALVVALVLLAAITVIGLSNMQSASVELKMISSQKQRNTNFAIAESALDQIRKQIIDGVPFRLSQDKDLYTDSCRAGRCFTDTCTNGRCFFGEYEKANSEFDCKVTTDSDINERVRVWENSALWSDQNKFATVEVGQGSVEVKYIMEFLCFGGEDYLDSIFNSGGAAAAVPSNPLAMLRVTVRYEPENGQPIMLHTMVLKKPIL